MFGITCFAKALIEWLLEEVREQEGEANEADSDFSQEFSEVLVFSLMGLVLGFKKLGHSHCLGLDLLQIGLVLQHSLLLSLPPFS